MMTAWLFFTLIISGLGWSVETVLRGRVARRRSQNPDRYPRHIP